VRAGIRVAETEVSLGEPDLDNGIGSRGTGGLKWDESGLRRDDRELEF